MLIKSEIGRVREKVRRDQSVDDWAGLFGVLGDQTRLCIFRIIAQRKNLCVTDIANVCNLTVPAVSHQLKILELAGLVRGVRHGKMICYELKRGERKVENILKLVIGNW